MRIAADGRYVATAVARGDAVILVVAGIKADVVAMHCRYLLRPIAPDKREYGPCTKHCQHLFHISLQLFCIGQNPKQNRAFPIIPLHIAPACATIGCTYQLVQSMDTTMAKVGTKRADGRRVKKPGPLSATEKRIALALKQLSPHLTGAAIGKVLNKKKAPIISYLLEARTLLQEAAPTAARHVLEASAIAAAQGDHRPAVWILEHISAVDEAGATFRIVDRPEVEHGQGLTVNIALPIGNIPMPPTRTLLPIEVTATPVTPVDSDT